MASTDRRRPNILFFLTDDQGEWALGCSGNQDIQTPHIDRLAREGVRFENFFCASPVCSPARASLLTGRIPSAHGVHDWIRGGNAGPGATAYLQDIRAYTEDLAQAGYQCALSGKWHLGDSANPQKGFSRWYAHQRGGGNYYGAPMVKNSALICERRYVTDAITDEALTFLEELLQDDAPFYLGVHYTAPHSPWDRANHPQDLLDLYEGCLFRDCPPHAPHPWAIFSSDPDAPRAEDPRQSLQGYYAAVTGADRGVGRLMERLRQSKAADNTLVVFTSDNGFNCGHHGIWGKGNGTFPLNMYDTSVKVPFIAWHPGRIPGGRVIRQMASAYDWMPTLLDYLGLPLPQQGRLPGHSFAGVLTGSAAGGHGAVLIADEYGPTRMIRTETDKYIRRYPYGPDEYYDLLADPGEEHNLVDCAEKAPRIARLRADMEAWFARYADPALDGLAQRVSGNGQLAPVGRPSAGEAFSPLGRTFTWPV